MPQKSNKRILFADLFEGSGTDGVGYSTRCQVLSGQEVEIQGWLSPAHDGSEKVLLVNQPGACPDCAPAPVPSLLLPRFAHGKIKTEEAVRLRGTLSYGLQIEQDGSASFLRLERARIATGLLK
jgi:hypothetical protein